MLNLLAQVRMGEEWPNLLKENCRANGLKLGVLHSLTAERVIAIYQSLYQSGAGSEQEARPDVWYDKQKTIYPFVLNCVSFTTHKPILEFEDQQYGLLQAIFPNKSRLSLQYEALLIVNSKEVAKRKWTHGEEKLLMELVSLQQGESSLGHQKYKWKEISKQLLQQSNFQYFRMSKACRQKWYNHLDPQKKHGNWQTSQDKIIVQVVYNKGKKWSDIAKKLDKSRTQHMIKNRYKSLLIHHQKKLNNTEKEEKILSNLAKEMDIQKTQKLLSKRREKEEQEPLSQQFVKVEDKVEVKDEIKREQNGDVNNYSPFCYVATPSTVPQFTPIIYGNSPSMPMYLKSFSDGFANVQYFMVGTQGYGQQEFRNQNP